MTTKIYKSTFFKISEEEKKELAARQKQLEKEVINFRDSTRPPLVSEGANDPRIIEMREIKKKHVLRSRDIVEELEAQNYYLTKSSLSAYLQGNVRGTDARNWSATGKKIQANHIDDLLQQFRKMDKRLTQSTVPFQNKSMREIIEGWGEELNVQGESTIRTLSNLSWLDFSTLYKWYQENRKPRTMKYLVGVQEIIDKTIGKKNRATVKSVKRSELEKISLSPIRKKS